MKKKSTPKKKKNKEELIEIFSELHNGHIPEEIILIVWRDILEHYNSDLRVKPIVIMHSTGVLASVDSEKINLLQTWDIRNHEDDEEIEEQGNVCLALPKGVVKKIYKYRLEEVEELE